MRFAIVQSGSSMMAGTYRSWDRSRNPVWSSLLIRCRQRCTVSARISIRGKSYQFTHEFSQPRKLHIARCVLCVFFRLKETGRGLACDSESSAEASHIDFDRTWLRFMVRDATSPQYRPQLLQAVLSFNAAHIQLIIMLMTAEVLQVPWNNPIREESKRDQVKYVIYVYNCALMLGFVSVFNRASGTCAMFAQYFKIF